MLQHLFHYLPGGDRLERRASFRSVTRRLRRVWRARDRYFEYSSSEASRTLLRQDFSLSLPAGAGQTGLGRALHRVIETAETSGPIEQAAARLHSVIAPALDGRRRRELLHGAWLGHAAHPFFTDFAEGAWMAASFLDLFGPEGSEAPAQRLLGFGLLAAVPTALTGLADWTRSEGPARQSGLIHAGTSSVATLLYAASYLARRSDKEGPAVVLGVAGGILATLDGWIGGHLSLSRGVGVENSL